MEYTIVIMLLLFSGSLHALNCPCHTNRQKCKKIKCKPGVAIIKDACGCCNVCSQQMWQKCGGPWNALGKCDPTKKLICAEKPICGLTLPGGSPYAMKMPGICIPRRHYKIMKKYCKRQRDLFCTTNPFGHHEE